MRKKKRVKIPGRAGTEKKIMDKMFKENIEIEDKDGVKFKISKELNDILEKTIKDGTYERCLLDTDENITVIQTKKGSYTEEGFKTKKEIEEEIQSINDERKRKRRNKNIDELLDD